jgi:hypothetical protein
VICNDGAPSVLGSIKSFTSLVNQQNPGKMAITYFLHREVVVGKTLGGDLKSVLDQAVGMFNSVKSIPVLSSSFATQWIDIINV